MRRQAGVVALFVLLFAVLTCSDDRQPSLLQPSAPEYTPSVGGLELGPIEGLTTGWHAAPNQFAIPLGSAIQLRCQARPADNVVWTGASEVSRDDYWSVATCPTDHTGRHAVAVVVERGAGQGNARDKKHGDSLPTGAAPLACAFEVVESRSVFSASKVQLTGRPLAVDDKSDAWQALRAFSASSIAQVREIAPQHFVTSTETDVNLSCHASAPEYAPLVEWRIDGTPVLLGATNVFPVVLTPGAHSISVGPPARAVSVRLDVYRVTIDSPPDALAESMTDAPITFRATTDPPGFEEYITWLAVTQYGSATPRLGQGREFTVRFRDTVATGAGNTPQKWVGVRADQATLTSDAAPTITFVSPANGEVITHGTILAARMPASMTFASVKFVRFYYSANGATYTPLVGFGKFDGNFSVPWNTSTLPGGTYFVRVRLTTTTGQTATDQVQVTVDAAPQPIATASVASSLTINLNATTSFDPDGSIAQYLWSFDEGGTATGATVQHTYTTTGTYYLSLTTVDNLGGRGTSHYKVDLPSPFTLDFQGKPKKCGCASMAVLKTGPVVVLNPPLKFKGGGDGIDGVQQGFLGPYWDGTDFSYRFEVVATLKPNSDPGSCAEGQRIKATWTRTLPGPPPTTETIDHKASQSRVNAAYDSWQDADDPYDPNDGAAVDDSVVCGYNSSGWCDDKYHGGADRWGKGTPLSNAPTDGSLKAYSGQTMIAWLDAGRYNNRALADLPMSIKMRFNAIVSGELGTCECDWQFELSINAQQQITGDLTVLNCSGP